MSPSILVAFPGSAEEFRQQWATPDQKACAFRTDLGRLRRALSLAASTS